MSTSISRRTALKTGAVSTGLMIGAVSSKSTHAASQESTHPPFLYPWSPPEDLERDLTPGPTTVRLASWGSKTTLNYTREGKESITEIIKRVRDMGYTSTNSSIRTSPWLTATDAEIKELHTALKKYDVTFFDMHTTGSNIHYDPIEREKVYRYTVESCEAAERVGCPMVTTHTGAAGYDRAMSAHKDNWTWKTWKASVNAMKKILKDTSGMKVKLAVEPTNMTAMNNPRALLQIVEECADPRLQVCIDPVNMIYIGNYFRTTELINESFDLLGDTIIASHAKDTLCLHKMSIYLTEVAPGKGILNYETYLVRLSRLSNTITLLIEHIPDEEYAGAKKYIEDTAAKVGVKIYR